MLHHRELRLSEAVVGRLRLLLLRLRTGCHVALQQDLLMRLVRQLLWKVVSLAVHYLDEATLLR